MSDSKTIHNIIVITGTTGINLKKYADFLSKVIDGVDVVDFEKDLLVESSNSIGDILGELLQNPTEFSKRLKNAIDELKQKSENLILVSHLSYWRRGFTIPNPLFLSSLNDLQISKIILILEDYYHALLNIAKRNYDHPLGDIICPLTYLNWRATDLAFALTLKSLGYNVIIIGAKHSKKTFKRLGKYISEDTNIPVYFSHPISYIRRKSIQESCPLLEIQEVQEIEEFKKELVSELPNLILYEPTTIDEKIYNSDGSIVTNITQKNRWPHARDTPNGEYKYPVDLKGEIFKDIFDTGMLDEKAYLRLLEQRIDQQIALRDFHYVDQSKVVLVYRPTMGGDISRGVFAEIQRASARGTPVWVYIPQDNTEEYKAFTKSGGIFITLPNIRVFRREEQLIKEISAI